MTELRRINTMSTAHILDPERRHKTLCGRVITGPVEPGDELCKGCENIAEKRAAKASRE